jgi:hypothetical protein
MNNSFERLIDGVNATLREEVLTRLDDEFARGQVFGIINVLNNLRLKADWSVNFLFEAVVAQQDALAKVKQVALQANLKVPASAPQLPTSLIDAKTLLDQRELGNLALIEHWRWFWEQRKQPANLATLSEGQLQAIEAALRGAMRREVEVELKHLGKPMFAEMSQGSE